MYKKYKKGKGFPYSLPSVGPGTDPGVQAVSPQVSHPPGGRLPLLSARPVVTCPATEHHRPLASNHVILHIGVNNLCKAVTQLLPHVKSEPTTCWSLVQHSTRCATARTLKLSRNTIWYKITTISVFGKQGVGIDMLVANTSENFSQVVTRGEKGVQSLLFVWRYAW